MNIEGRYCPAQKLSLTVASTTPLTIRWHTMVRMMEPTSQVTEQSVCEATPYLKLITGLKWMRNNIARLYCSGLLHLCYITHNKDLMLCEEILEIWLGSPNYFFCSSVLLLLFFFCFFLALGCLSFRCHIFSPTRYYFLTTFHYYHPDEARYVSWKAMMKSMLLLWAKINSQHIPLSTT